ncbi:MAG TPA: SPFH domain-containing protein, partial [Ilumatobacteraceae bacterium]
MNVVGVIILLAVAVPLIAFLVWQFLTEARVQIEAGNIGLLIARGKVKDRAPMPGVHYVWPFRRQMIQEYTLRELSYVAGDEPSDDVAVSAHLGDKTKVDVSYTVRYKVDPDGLRTVH